MRTPCLIVAFFIAINLSFAEEEPLKTRALIKLIYKDGYLINVGEEALLRVEIIDPFYRYLGDIEKDKTVNIKDVKTKFTVRYTIRAWIGEYETMTQSFIPVFDTKGPDPGLEVNVDLKGDILSIKVTSIDKITGIFIEILSDIPIKISNDRIRYVLSNVGVVGQSLQSGPEATFKIVLLIDQDFYKVPIQISYIFQGSNYDKIFTFSFRREDFKK
jgi:hypothetical protein